MSKPTGSTDFDEESEVEGPVSSFQSYAAEGDILAKQGDYRKAIDAYSKALTLRPTDKNCLVSRSKCFLQLGDARSALADADTSLKEDSDFFKGKFQKAEALYAMGDFEMALVYYHRGNKLRPELDEFRLGIQKAREAIDNSIGNPRDYKLHSPGSWATGSADKSAVGTGPGGGPLSGKAGTLAALDRRGAGGMGGGDGRGLHGGGGGRATTGKSPGPGGTAASGVGSGMGGGAVGGMTASGAGAAGAGGGAASGGAAGGGASEKTLKQLLGELYADREYLQKLYDDRDFVNNPNDRIYSLVSDGLKYLDTRIEFWRQQKPMYARKKEHSRIQAKANNAKARQAALQSQKKGTAIRGTVGQTV